ncbi:MAG: O-antigen ligase family protein [Solirubrobacterales bacterium]|nr:O-antigen ligase family protein [Solirubrobacterales bacterium]
MTAWHPWGQLRSLALTAAVVLAACLFVAASVQAAFLGQPLAGIGLVIVLSVALATPGRPEIGVTAVLALVALSPLQVLGNPPWLLPLAGTVGLLALALLAPRAAGAPGVALPALGPFVLALLVVPMVSLLTTDGALDEAFPVLRALATGAMLFVAITLLLRERAQVLFVVRGLSAIAIGVGGYATFLYLSGGGGGTGFFVGTGTLVTRVAFASGSPNQVAGFLLLLVPFAAAAVLYRGPGRLLGGLALVLSVAGIYVTFSRAALIAVAVIPLFFIRPRWSVTLAPLLVLGLLLGGPEILKERFSTLNEDGSEVATRTSFWTTGLSVFASDPLLGVGPGGFPDAYAQAKVPAKQFLPQAIFEPPPHAHNLFINTAAEQGALGLSALVAALVAAALLSKRLRYRRVPWAQPLGRAGFAMLAAFVVHSLFDVTFLESTATTLLALLAVLSAADAISAREVRDG